MSRKIVANARPARGRDVLGRLLRCDAVYYDA